MVYWYKRILSMNFSSYIHVTHTLHERRDRLKRPPRNGFYSRVAGTGISGTRSRTALTTPPRARARWFLDSGGGARGGRARRDARTGAAAISDTGAAARSAAPELQLARLQTITLLSLDDKPYRTSRGLNARSPTLPPRRLPKVRFDLKSVRRFA